MPREEFSLWILEIFFRLVIYLALFHRLGSSLLCLIFCASFFAQTVFHLPVIELETVCPFPFVFGLAWKGLNLQNLSFPIRLLHWKIFPFDEVHMCKAKTFRIFVTKSSYCSIRRDLYRHSIFATNAIF